MIQEKVWIKCLFTKRYSIIINDYRLLQLKKF